MASYTLHLEIDRAKVAQFNTQGWKLCFASGVEVGGNVDYSVVAFSRAIAENVNITWTDNYAIAASQDAFSNGMKFEASTVPLDIKFGQSYTQPKTWVTGTVDKDPQAPPKGFRFINNTSGAAAVVYKKINGVASPIYFSAKAPLPPGKEDLIPVNKVAVWFSCSAVTQTMISSFGTSFQVVDYTGKTQAAVKYNEEGDWSILA